MERVTTDHAMIQKSLAGTQYFFRRFRTDRCSEIAASLVYMSLFALVPLLTVVYAVGSALPTGANVQLQIEQFLTQNLLPESSQEVAVYLHRFSEQAKNLTGVGIGILAITAVLMLRNVERAFNNIWRTKENRGAVSSFLLYWAVLSLTPVILGLGLGIQAYLYAVAQTMAGIDVLGVGVFLLSLLPFFLSIIGLSALYMAVPNCAVPLRHALVGGCSTAIALSIAKTAFTAVIANSSYALVYGAFAAVPVFLLWLYIIWTIVLGGAIVVHSLSAYQNKEQANRPLLLKALDILYVLWRAQQRGEAVSELALLKNRDVIVGGLDGESWRHIRDKLTEDKLMRQSSQGEYLLSKDLSTVSLNALKTVIDAELGVPSTPDDAMPWQVTAHALLCDQRDEQQHTLAVPLSNLFCDRNDSLGSPH